jgi:hypothetical protein
MSFCGVRESMDVRWLGAKRARDGTSGERCQGRFARWAVLARRFAFPAM